MRRPPVGSDVRKRSGFNADVVKNSPVSVVGVRIGAHITKIDGIDVSNMTHFKIIKILKRKMKETKMVTFTCLDEGDNDDDGQSSTSSGSSD